MAESTVPVNSCGVGNSEVEKESTRETERYIAPAVDIYEDEQGLTVQADLPGLDENAVEVSVEDDVLTIKGIVSHRNDQTFAYREFEPVGYFRQFNLGNKLDRTKISADYRNGVLEVKLPFAEEAKPKRIPIGIS